MWWESRRLASLLLSSILGLYTLAPAAAERVQAKRAVSSLKHVISVVPDQSGKLLVITTAEPSGLPAPSIRFFAGQNGQAVMAAEFSPCALSMPAQLFALGDQGVHHVRIGQFEDSPPVVRISFIASSPDAFKTVAFKSAASALIVKLGDSPEPRPETTFLPPPEKSVAPVQAPARTLNKTTSAPPSAPRTAIASMPPTAPDRAYGVRIVHVPPNAVAAPRLKLSSMGEPIAAPLRGPIAMPAIAPAVIAPGEVETLKLSADTKGDELRVRLSAPSEIKYKSFRLHDPERYVIDVQGRLTVELPAGIDQDLVSGVRSSNLDADGERSQTTRIVFDLKKAGVAVDEEMTAGNQLSLALKQGIAPKPEKLAQSTAIVLDAGHGGSDPGAQRGVVQEKELTLEIVERLKKALEDRGIRTILTRTDDTFVSLEDRVKIANASGADAFVSVHINSLETNNAIQGIETYYQNDRSKDLAQLIHESLVKALGVPDRSVRKARFYVINHTPLPAVLAEVGFISNKEERDKLISGDYQKHIADALSDGVVRFLVQQAELRQTAAGTRGTEVASTSEKSFTQNLQTRNGHRP